MRKILCVLILVIAAFPVLAQRGSTRATTVTFNTNPGYINTTEITPGIGIGETGVPYANFLIGITNISGYQIGLKNSMVTKKIQGGVGTGVYIYNEGTLMPLFLDFRFIWNEKTWTPYVYASGGGLLHFNDFNNESRLFINPGAGVRYTISESLALSAGLGIMVQSASYRRDSFINLKIGLCFKP